MNLHRDRIVAILLASILAIAFTSPTAAIGAVVVGVFSFVLGAWHGFLSPFLMLADLIGLIATGAWEPSFSPVFLNAPGIPTAMVFGWWIGYAGNLLLAALFIRLALSKPRTPTAGDDAA